MRHHYSQLRVRASRNREWAVGGKASAGTEPAIVPFARRGNSRLSASMRNGCISLCSRVAIVGTNGRSNPLPIVCDQAPNAGLSTSINRIQVCGRCAARRENK